MKKWFLFILGMILVGMAGLYTVGRMLVGQPYTIMSRSMLPLLKPEDVVFCFGEDARALTYGDVVVYTHPSEKAEGAKFIKLVVGFGGDTIQVKGGNLWINGKAVASRSAGQFEIPGDNGHKVPRFEETFPDGVQSSILIEDPESPVNNTAPVEVPANHIFVIGSFRDNSSDSRITSAHGMVPVENIICKLEQPEEG
ncbi:MAG: signal peptidase I [Pseudomonadota bacterium]